MKLNYQTTSSFSKYLIIYVNILLLHITLIHSLTPKSLASHDKSKQQRTTTTTASPPTIDSNNYHHSHQDDYYKPLSENDKKIVIEQLKTNLLKALGLKEAPKKPENKAYVPRDMLERYKQFRESVRDTIPDDRDFYGKISIDDHFDPNNDDFWSTVHHRFGSYDIEVDMANRHKLPNRMTYEGDAKQVACIGPMGDPQEIPAKMEHLLLPHSPKQQFISVLLNFNLTQEIYIDQLKVEDVKAAELHISRERISDCQNGLCITSSDFKDKDKHEADSPRTNGYSTKDRTSLIEETNNMLHHVNNTRLRNRPRYQRVYILQVLGYDTHGDIMTRIHDSLRVNTYETTPLKIDISKILRDWLQDPEKNYGIVVRVTNDDQEYQKIYNANLKESINQSNASHLNADQEFAQHREKYDLSEHVRLKRDFRSEDYPDEIWIAKRPSVLIFSNPSEVARSHVKREDSMYNDEPEAGVTGDYVSTISSQSTQSSDDMNGDSQTSKPNATPQRASSNRRSNSTGRRENRNSNRATTQRTPSQTNGQESRRKSKGKPPRTEKCSKKTMSINFDEVGWSSWIIAPQAYYADYCAGDCSFPMSDHQNATNHAIIQSIYHTVGRPVPRSCCAPTKLGKMAILYQIDGGVQMKEYNDMIVESCGCL